ncbi:hypothetical protein [Megamonas funiformis]|uniref:hypothetical protein n=1 Tax=Megamonas funiformis TaxID=437897 RepID=UPI00241EB42E|nr:hypothetical protein [Megamonas funiformis]
MSIIMILSSLVQSNNIFESDEIIYEYKDILNALDEFISQQNCIVEDEKQVVEIIKSVLLSD